MLDTNHTVEVPEGIELNLPLAGPVVRSLAFMIDMAIRIGVYFVIGTIFGVMGRFGGGLFLIFIFLLEWAYPILFEIYNQGATPGKKMMGIKVVNDDGTPITWGPSIVRNLLRAADAFPVFYLVGLISMMIHHQFKRLGDLAAGTLVIHKNSYTPSGSLQNEKPQQAPVNLTLEEQRAILHFGERSHQLSEARNHELADILSPILEGKDAKERMSNIVSMANWFRGRR
ncbi:RDD family protein [Pleionea sediminis]|uniref:RDD family protein n=1 Tax=Pleionea sediminis TaxID=2569479 RepID=UPI0011857E9D|nr:RDD family protein [Pleionea sediminis]